MKFLQILWIIISALATSTTAISQSFCLSDPSINKKSAESYIGIKNRRERCQLYWINIFIHRVIGTQNGWNGYTSSIDTKIMQNLNSSYNQYGFYFELSGSRDWFTNDYTSADADPAILEITLSGIFDDPAALQHKDAIDIYLLPLNIPIKGGGFVPSNNKKVMLLGGTRNVDHCTGGSTLFEIATSKVVSHEMGHCFGLPHTFDVSLGTSVDYVRNRECVDPGTCQFVSNCAECNVNSNPTLNMDNFMSYTIPDCMSLFSKEQVDLMKDNLDETMVSVVGRTQGLPTDIVDIIGPSEVSKGFLVSFDASDLGDENETFVWEMPTGFLRTEGEDTNRSIQTWIGSIAESGNVRVWKTNLCGDGNTKYKYVTVIPDDCIVCPMVKILPNPAFDEIFISYSSQEYKDQELFDKPREYLIIDSQGKSVFKYKSRQTNLRLDISRINQNGTYILSIKHRNSGIYGHRLIINR